MTEEPINGAQVAGQSEEKKGGGQTGWWVAIGCLGACVGFFVLVCGGISGELKGTNNKDGANQDDLSTSLLGTGDDCVLNTDLDLNAAIVKEVKLTTTGYYSPLPGQSKYSTGSYEGDIKMNGKGVKTKSGIEVAKGTVAVDTNIFPHGTVFDIPGYGKGYAIDTGGGIKKNHIDLWMGKGEEALDAALKWGNKPVIVKVYSWPSINDKELIKHIKRTCQNIVAVAGKGCQNIANNAMAQAEKLRKWYKNLWNYMPGRKYCADKYAACGRYWCTDLVIDAYKLSGFNITTSKSAALMADWFKKKAIYFNNGSGNPAPGDFIDFFQNGGSGHHVGIVTSVNGSCFITAESNTRTRNHRYCLKNGTYKGNGSRIFGFARLKNCNNK